MKIDILKRDCLKNKLLQNENLVQKDIRSQKDEKVS